MEVVSLHELSSVYENNIFPEVQKCQFSWKFFFKFYTLHYTTQILYFGNSRYPFCKFLLVKSQRLVNIEAILRELEVLSRFIIGGHNRNIIRYADYTMMIGDT